MMLPETKKQRIEHDAQHRYSKHKEGLYKDNCVACYIAGATAEAERSAAWKAEATLLINKIHDWAEGDKTLPLGHSVFDEAVKRLKAYDELLKAKAEPGDKSALPDNKDREKQAIGLLTSLCDLKQYKDTTGKDEYYEENKERAWDNAFKFLESLTNKQ